GHRAHAVYDHNLLQEVGRTVMNAIDSLRLVHQDWELVSAAFSEGKLLIRNLNAARPGQAAALAVVADARLNPSFAGVAIRVPASRLRSTPAATPVRVPPPAVHAAEPDPRAAAFLSACATALAASVGPMAKVFVKEAVRGLCGPAPFGREHVLPLIAQLERHI